MRISEILLEARKKKEFKTKDVERDDEIDTIDADPDQDKVQHIVMQLRKAKDVDGDYPITFADMKKYKLKLQDIDKFLHIYDRLKPIDREMMQNMASRNLEGFHKALNIDVKEPTKHKIKGTRYMSHFSGDHDEK